MITVVMPKLNFDMTSGTIDSWTKQVGEHMERG